MHEHELIERSGPEIPATPRHPTRTIVATLLLSGLVVGGVIVARRRDDAPTAAPTPVTKEVVIERGDLTDQQSVDGTLVETDTITVVHRIEGQTTSFTANSSTSASSGANGGTAPSGPAAAGAALSATATDAVQSTRTELATTLAVVELARPAVDTTTVDTTTPVTTPDTTTPDTTTPDTTTPDTTTPVTTVPSGPPGTVPTGSSVPTGGGAPGGGVAPSGGIAPTTGAGSTGTGATGTVSQIVTGVASANDSIQSGDVLYTVESAPVVALRGALPAWRTMSNNSTDGADIQQLEAALVALGYDVDGDVTVDQEWDRSTTAMVQRWQRGLGVDDTGDVTLGSVVFISHDATVAQVDVTIGDSVQDGSTVLQLSGTQQQVIITVPDELQASLAPSTSVQWSDGTGVVTRLRSAEADDGSITVQALITPDAAIDAPAGTTVKVTLSTSVATSALLVQTDAIVSLLDGSYGLEVPDAGGGHHFVTITVLGVSGNRTAIESDDVREGMAVLAPA